MIGATAAIALPPQIAVPVEISAEAVWFTFNARPSQSREPQRERDSHCRVNESAAPGHEHFVQIHPEPQTNHGTLQQIFRHHARLCGIRMFKCESKNEAKSEGDRRRDQAGPTQHEACDKQYLRDQTSSPIGFIGDTSYKLDINLSSRGGARTPQSPPFHRQRRANLCGKS